MYDFQNAGVYYSKEFMTLIIFLFVEQIFPPQHE